MVSAFNGLMESLAKLVPPEIIDGANVVETATVVDLTVEFTPVLPAPVGCYLEEGWGPRFVPTPCRVQQEGARWCVWIPYSSEKYRWVTDEQLKVMRARYLLLKAFYYRTIEGMTHSQRSEVISKFFPGGLFKPSLMTALDKATNATT